MAVKSNPGKKPTGGYEEKGTPGLGKMVVLENGKVRFNLEIDGKPVEIHLEKEALPKNVPAKVGKEYSVNVTPNKANTSVVYVNPASGDFTLRFQRFSGAEDEPPAPQTKEGKWGAYSETYALMEVASGAWRGTIFPFKLSMKWLAPDEDGNLEVIGSNDYAQKWRDFFKLVGVESHPEQLIFSENPLPAIQEMAKEQDTQFKGVVVRGWLETIYEELALDDDEDNVDNVHPPVTEETKTHPALDE